MMEQEDGSKQEDKSQFECEVREPYLGIVMVAPSSTLSARKLRRTLSYVEG